MSDLKIITFPHPTLRHKSKPVTRVDGELRKIIGKMFELMYEANGVGLAANQVNLPLRLFVCNPTAKSGEGEEHVFINPVISKAKGSAEAEEGCLSLPGVYASVIRPDSIHVEAYDLQGNQIKMDLKGFFGRVIQHETDHLDGVMFTDRLSETGKADVEHDIEEFRIDFESQQAAGQIPGDQELAEHRRKLEAKYCSA